MTGYLFRGTWPIEPGADLSPVGVRRLEVEAARHIDGLAREAGCVLVPGHPVVWSIVRDVEDVWLVGEAPAWPAAQVAA